MKRDFVKDLLKNLGLESSVEKAIIDSIMNENGKDVNEANEKVKALESEKTTLTTERDDLKTQLATRDSDIESLKKKVADNEDLSTQLADWQTKYKTDTDDLNAKLASQAKSHATEKFFEGYQFTSDLAKRAAIAEFEKKDLKYEDGKFLGAEDFMTTLKEENPTAFVAEKKEDNVGTPPPSFVLPTNGNPKGDDNPFNFGFAGVRKAPSDK